MEELKIGLSYENGGIICDNRKESRIVGDRWGRWAGVVLESLGDSFLIVSIFLAK